MSAVRVAIVDDHPTFRAGLRSLVARMEGITPVGECGSGEEALELLAGAEVDVVVMDVLMPGMGGIEATRRLAARHPDTKVLVMSMSERDDAVYLALQAGARGYLVKDAEPEDIEVAIRAVASGSVLLDRRAGDRMAAYFHGSGPVVPPFPGLSVREREVLSLVAHGLDNAAIASRLHLASKTVRNQVSTILTKLDVPTRAAAVARARDAGLGPGA